MQHMSYGELCHDPPPIKEAKLGRKRLESLDRRSLWRENIFGENVVTVCASVGNADMLEWLIKTFDVDVNTKDWDERPLLSLAAENGQANVVRLLLALGCDVAEECNRGELSPLDYAALNGHVGVIRALVPYYAKNQVRTAYRFAMGHSRLYACLAFHQYDPTLIGDTSSLVSHETPAQEAQAKTTDQHFVIWHFSQMMLDRTTSKKTGLGSSCAAWTPSTLQTVEKLTNLRFSLQGEKEPLLFWHRLAEAGNVALFVWLYQNRDLRPSQQERTFLREMSLANGHPEMASYASYPIGFANTKCDKHPNPIGDFLDKGGGDDGEKRVPKECTLMPVHPPKMNIRDYIEHAASGGGKSLEWLFAYESEGAGLSRLLNSDFEDFVTWPASTLCWMKENGWAQISKEARHRQQARRWRQNSLDPEHWPRFVDAAVVLEKLKLWSELFEWTREDLTRVATEPMDWNPLEEGDSPTAGLPPLVWAVVHRLPKVFEWLYLEKKVDWKSVGNGNAEKASCIFYAGACFPCYNESMGPDRLRTLPMLRFLRYVVKIPLPSDPASFIMLGGDPQKPAQKFENAADHFDHLTALFFPDSSLSIRWFIEAYSGADWLRMCQSCDSFFGAPRRRVNHPHIGTRLSKLDRLKELQHIRNHLTSAAIDSIRTLGSHFFRILMRVDYVEYARLCYNTMVNNEVYSSFAWTLDERVIEGCKLDNCIRYAKPYFVGNNVETLSLVRYPLATWLTVALSRGSTLSAGWLVDELGVSLENPLISRAFENHRHLAYQQNDEAGEKLRKTLKWLRRRGVDLGKVELRPPAT